MLEPRDSKLRPMSAMTSAPCCGLPHHVNPVGVQAMMRPRWFPSTLVLQNKEALSLAEPAHRMLRPAPGPDGRMPSADPSARKSSSWHIVENPHVSWWNVMGTSCTEARPAAAIVSMTVLPYLMSSSHFAHTSLSPRQRDVGANAKPLDVVQYPLPSLLHLHFLYSFLRTEDALLVLYRDKDRLHLTGFRRGAAEIPERCATRRRDVLWLMNRRQPRNGALSFVPCSAATTTPCMGLVTTALLLVLAIALTSSWRTNGAGERPEGCWPLEHCSKSWPVPPRQRAPLPSRQQDPPVPITFRSVQHTRCRALWPVQRTDLGTTMFDLAIARDARAAHLRRPHCVDFPMRGCTALVQRLVIVYRKDVTGQ